MPISTHSERTLTELDHARLVKLTSRLRADPPEGGTDSIQEALDSGRVVPSRSVAPDVVTMYSQVSLEDAATGHRFRITPCYPSDAEPAAGFVSVLSPVGASVLGLQVGSTARWVTPRGESRAAEVLAILFQPEASGDFTL